MTFERGHPTDGLTVALPLGTEPDGVNHHRGVYIPPGWPMVLPRSRT